MNTIFVIAKNTFREVIRDRILYILFFFAVLVISMSLVLGQLSFGEQSRIAANYGFSGIQISMVVISIFIGCTLVRKELDKKTAFTLLARPVTRLQFLLSKILGFSFAVFCLLIGFCLILSGILLFLGFSFSITFMAVFWGIYLESLLLVCLSVLFSTFSGPFIAPSFTFGCFVIGHWVNDMKFFADKSDSDFFKIFVDIFRSVFPNLEKFNWRAFPIYGESISFYEVLMSTLYCFLWVLILISFSGLFLRKKDLV